MSTARTRSSSHVNRRTVVVAAAIVPVLAALTVFFAIGHRSGEPTLVVLGVMSVSGFLRFAAIPGLPRWPRRVLTVVLATAWWTPLVYTGAVVFALFSEVVWPWTDWASPHATLRPIATSDDFEVRTSWSRVAGVQSGSGASSHWAVQVMPIFPYDGATPLSVRTTTVDRATHEVIASDTRVVRLEEGAQLRYRVRADGTWTDVEAGAEVVGGWVAFR